MRLPKVVWDATGWLWDKTQSLLVGDLSELELAMQTAFDDPEEVDGTAQPFGPDWSWLVPMGDTGGLPLFLPDDMLDDALVILSQETIAEEQAMQGQQWWWRVNAMGVRQIMHIAQAEPDIEVALLMWAAHAGPPQK